MATYRISITTDSAELLNVIEIDTDDKNWNTPISKGLFTTDVFDEIQHAEKIKTPYIKEGE